MYRILLHSLSNIIRAGNVGRDDVRIHLDEVDTGFDSFNLKETNREITKRRVVDSPKVVVFRARLDP